VRPLSKYNAEIALDAMVYEGNRSHAMQTMFIDADSMTRSETNDCIQS
jgi:hypothetical protein